MLCVPGASKAAKGAGPGATVTWSSLAPPAAWAASQSPSWPSWAIRPPRRLQGRRRDWLSSQARSHRAYRPKRTGGARPAARQGTMGRRHRHRGQPDPGHAARPDPVPRGGGRICRRWREEDDLPATVLSLYPASGVFARDRLAGMCPRGAPRAERGGGWVADSAYRAALAEEMTTVEPMSKVLPEPAADTILAGRTRGRVVIDTSS